MAANKTRTRAERETHLSRVTALYCQGVRQIDIAAQLGVTPAQITYDMRILIGRWRRASTGKIDEWIATELERINHLERTYWQAWIESSETAVKIAKEKTVGKDVVTLKQERIDASGDPRFLQGVQWCIDQRCKLLGLYAPVKQEVSAFRWEPETCTDEQLARIAAGENPKVVLTEPRPSNRGNSIAPTGTTERFTED